MTYAVRVRDEYVGLMGRYVVAGQSIAPGAPLLDIMTPEGVVETILSEGWGVIAHVEGGRIFPRVANTNDDEDEEIDAEERGDDEDDSEDGESGSARSSSGGLSIVFSKGQVLCHIVDRSQGGSMWKTGLHPRPARSVQFRRAMGLAPR